MSSSGAQDERAALHPRQWMRAEAFDHAVEQLELTETHISWIVLTGRYAYKLKKTVKLDFIDASSLEKRRVLCEDELRLNRRLAPELYIDVMSLRRDASGIRFGSAGEPIEYAVQMHQFDRAQELSSLLARDDVSPAEIEELARTLGAFHARTPSAGRETRFGSYVQVRQTVLTDLDILDAQHDGGSREALERVTAWTRAALERLSGAIEARKSAGAVRECHGDLHSRNIVRWQGRLLPFDCLEFNPSLRWIDVADEMAFLYMDLLAHDSPDLASCLLSVYFETTGDYQALSLLRFYAVHRALVRAKVDGIQAEDPTTGAELAAQLTARRAARLRLAARLTEDPDPPLIVMSGPSGSGKSWLSERLVSALGVLRIRSDLERKRLAGLGAQERAVAEVGRGIYGDLWSEHTYGRLLECAEHAVAGGFGTVVDAAFLDAAHRERFRELAARLRRRFLIVTCAADPEVLRARVRARALAARDPSDATLTVLEHQLATGRPPGDAEVPYILTLDTRGLDAAAAVALVRRRLTPGARP